MELKRAVITGIGAVTPLGNSTSAFWDGIVNGRSGAARITHFNPERHKTQFGCEVKSFDPTTAIDKREVRKMDLFCQFAVVASEEAIKDSGMDPEKVNKDRIGVIWASGIGGIQSFQEEVEHFAAGDNVPHFSPFFVTKMITDMSAGLISIRNGFRGVNFSTVSACASSTHALVDALNYIRLGKADMIVSGGSEAPITESGVGGFNAMRALSLRNDSPETASRPFAVDRDGFVIGEGAGAIILEELEHAKKRGATIYAELVGGGLSADAYHISSPHPEGDGVVLAMRSALEDAHLDPKDVDYINTHATSTPAGDMTELHAVERLFGGAIDSVSISGTKSMTGHLLGAAGAIEAIVCTLSIRDSVIPPTINTTTLDPEVNPKLKIVLGEARKQKIDIAMSNTFGFGGHNAIAILRRFEG